MDYKRLFHIAMLLISSPAKAWEEIRIEDPREVFMHFVYPMIGLCALSVFLGSLFAMGWNGVQGFQNAMTKCCSEAVALFGGYFLAAYFIRMYAQRLELTADRTVILQFAGYSMIVVFAIHLVLGIMPELTFIAMLLQFYIIYIVWEGCGRLLFVPEDKRLLFTVGVSTLLLLCPYVIKQLFDKLTLALN